MEVRTSRVQQETHSDNWLESTLMTTRLAHNRLISTIFPTLTGTLSVTSDDGRLSYAL